LDVDWQNFLQLKADLAAPEFFVPFSTTLYNLLVNSISTFGDRLLDDRSIA
jgi:hypothetical protein